ncbi:hypothetical protein ACHWQZ_G009132 [Mnemiopsis leidyi]
MQIKPLTVFVLILCVVTTNGFTVGNPVWCNLCRPFGNEPTPEECSADSEYGMECQLCYQLSGPGSFLRETCVPVSQYMVTMDDVIQPELDLCWLRHQGDCVLRLLGPATSSSPFPTFSPTSSSGYQPPINETESGDSGYEEQDSSVDLGNNSVEPSDSDGAEEEKEDFEKQEEEEKEKEEEEENELEEAEELIEAEEEKEEEEEEAKEAEEKEEEEEEEKEKEAKKQENENVTIISSPVDGGPLEHQNKKEEQKEKKLEEAEKKIEMIEEREEEEEEADEKEEEEEEKEKEVEEQEENEDATFDSVEEATEQDMVLIEEIFLLAFVDVSTDSTDEEE